jgi:predicted nucleotidyltransferase
MPVYSDDMASAAAKDFACDMAAFWRARLGARLLGVYLIGSLAHGGFNRRYSDIDIALLVEDGLDALVFWLTRAKAAALSLQHSRVLSLFWADRHFSRGRFPLLDRVDYLDHAVPLIEREHLSPTRPSLDEIRAYLRGAPFANWAEDARRFVSCDFLRPKQHKAYVRTLLYPARLFYSWTTGRIASNDDAVAFLCDQQPAGLNVDLIATALQCRRAGADPTALFPARVALSGQIEACARLIASES